jgi:hypothetical protein
MNAADFAMDGPDLSPDELKMAVGGNKKEEVTYVWGAIDCRTRQVGGAYRVVHGQYFAICPAEATELFFGPGGPGQKHCCDD